MIGVSSNTGSYLWHDGETPVPTKLMLDFVCTPTGGELSTSEETSDSRWVPKSQDLELVTSPAIRLRYQAYLDFTGKIHYMEYVTRPAFEVKLQRTL